MRPSPSSAKALERERLAEDIEKFLARGREIEFVEQGVSGIKVSFGNPSTSKSKDRGRKSRYGS